MAEYLHNLFNPILLFGALGTVAILSLVFKENRMYRLFEHIFLGLALGYDLETTWTLVLRPNFWDPLTTAGQWAWIMTVPVGLMFYGVYTQRFQWMSRLIFGVFFGLAAGTVFQDFAGAVYSAGHKVLCAQQVADPSPTRFGRRFPVPTSDVVCAEQRPVSGDCRGRFDLLFVLRSSKKTKPSWGRLSLGGGF